MSTQPIVQAKNVTAGYGTTVVWSKANFSVLSGEFIGLLGSNGAGKSTLLRLLLGLAQPLYGQLELFGEAPKRGNNRIGYVAQRHFLDSETRIEALEYVRIGAVGNRWGFSIGKEATSERRRALEALELVDGVELAYRPLNQLSGGEMQRVFLAQALIAKPDLLLLDEPLANLDIRRETQLVRLVNEVVKKQNLTVIFIAHDINPLLPAVDRIIYIANGKVTSGTPAEVVTSQSLSALYGAPIEVLHDSRGRLAVLGVEEAVHHEQ